MNARYLAALAFAGTAAFIASPVLAEGTVDAHAATIIRASGAALGAKALARIHVIRADAQISAIGLKGTGTQWSGIASGHFAEYATLTPYEQDDGFDGRVAWNRDGSGLVWNDGSDAGRSLEIDNAFMSTYGLWKPHAGGATVAFVKTTTEKGSTYDVLRVTPPGSKIPMGVWFDASTHLPVRQVLTKGSTTTSSVLSDYRPVGGLMMPYLTHIDSSDGNNSDSTIVRYSIDPKDGAAHLARPTTTPHDFSMDGGKTSTTVPIDLVENHVYLNVTINGKGPYRFIFDTGGQNVIDPAVAREVGAFSKGSAQGSGVGEQTQSLSFATVDTLQVGDALLTKQLFAVAPVREGFGISAGQVPDGLIGWEVLARYVTSFNYAERTVSLSMPGTQTPQANAHVIPFVLKGTQPQIACAIDAIPSECTIDTGARDTMSFYTPYIAAHPDVMPTNATAPGMTGFGFGGPSFGRLGRVRTVGIGDFTLYDQIGDFSTQKAGAFVEPFVAANLGGNMLRRFDVTFDYGKQTMALAPNADLATQDAYERAGIFLLCMHGATVVADVRGGTPAAKAGIVKGDAIVAIDGKTTSGMSLEAVRATFFAPAGTTVQLTLKAKDGTTRAVALTLADYV